MKWPDTSPTTDADGWTERHGCYSKTFGGVASVSVSWSTDRAKPGYSLRVMDRDLKTNAKTVEEGKSRVVNTLRGLLEKALVELKTESR